MKKVLTVALSSLLLLAGAALAEAPNAIGESAHSPIGRPDVPELPDGALAEAIGAGWRAETCTAGFKLAGAAFLVAGVLNGNPLQTGIGIGLMRLKCY